MTAPFIERLGWTLVHSVWQLAALALLQMFLLRLLAHASSRARYNRAALALAAMAACLPATFYLLPAPSHTIDATALAPAIGARRALLVEARPAEAPTTRAAAAEPVVAAAPMHLRTYLPRPSLWRAYLQAQIQPWLTTLVACWLLGIGLLSLRPLAGWREVRRLRHCQRSPAPPEVVALVRRLADRLRILRTVEVTQSALVQVPAVAGWLSPLILLPMGISQGLTPAQLESILAHELAHVRRHDYLVNLLQTLVETLLFYHPAVWWASHQMRLEREDCCDDLALSVCPDRGQLARALLALDERRGGVVSPAMAASGGSLLLRIRRILGSTSAEDSRASGLIGTMTFLAIVAVLALAASPTASIEAEEPIRAAAAQRTPLIETGTLAGRFLYDGPMPAPAVFKLPQSSADATTIPDERIVIGRDGGLANVFVYLIGGEYFRDLPVKAIERPAAVLRILDRRFQPHAFTMHAEQNLRIENLDRAGIETILHGIYNKASSLIPGREDAVLQLKAEKFPIPVTASIQPWFKGWLLPCEHDFHAVSQSDGTFSIPRLPPGEWEFRAWHEGCGYLGLPDWPKGRFTLMIKPGQNDLGTVRIPAALLTREAKSRKPSGNPQAPRGASAEPWFWPDPFPHLGHDNRKGDGWSYLRMAADDAAGDEVGIDNDQHRNMLQLYRDCEQREKELAKKLYEEGRADAAAWPGRLQELWSKTMDTAREQLSAAQHRHLQQLVIQRKSYNAFRDAELVQRLELTSDQHTRILSAIDAHLWRIKQNESLPQTGSNREPVVRPREQAERKAYAGRQSHRQVWDTIHDVLSPQQREQFNRLRGPMPEHVRSQLSMFEPPQS